MLTIIDKYILKKYLATFGVMLALFVPIGIVIDVSEKVDKMIENHIPILQIIISDISIFICDLVYI
jgi:lipopolysaccharide export system permease protein